jgi:hypothetical protein
VSDIRVTGQDTVGASSDEPWASLRQPVGSGDNGRPDALKRDRQLLLNELSFEPQYDEAEPTKVTLAALVSRDLASMNKAVNFHDEAQFRRQEVSDEVAAHWHLAAELDSEGTRAN